MIVPGILAGAGNTGELWTPANLPTPPDLWFNDDSSITTVSGLVSQWNDISGNDYHFSQNDNASRRPTPLAAELNGRRVVSFDGSDDMLYTTNAGARALCRNRANIAHFGVVKRRTAGGNTNAILMFNAAANGFSRSTIALNGGGAGETDKVRYIQRTTDAGGISALVQSTVINGAWQIFCARGELANTDGYLDINGALDQSNTSFTAGSATQDTSASIGPSLGAAVNSSSGNPPTSDTPVPADLAEFFTVLDAVSTDNTRRIEGYLAHRWGLTGNLPSDHPYKTFPPRV